MQQTHTIRIHDHVLDLVKLPEAAQEELVAFYEFLVYKYQRQVTKDTSEKQRVLSAMFDEAKTPGVPCHVTWSAATFSKAAKGLPVARWHIRQWQIEATEGPGATS